MINFNIWLELMDNRYAKHVIHQDIQGQLLICILSNYFQQLNLHQICQFLFDLTIKIICIQMHDIFTWLTIIIWFHVFIICFTKFRSGTNSINKFLPFSINEYMSVSEISTNYILVILSIASQFNLGLLK